MQRILTIAGSDSGGGAGIQADLKAITVLGGYGMSVLTALTAQNSIGVQGIHVVPLDFIRLQLDTVLSDIGTDAVKTGMLADAQIVRTVSQGLHAHQVHPIIVDPVMVAESGDTLLSEDAVQTLKTKLLPLAYLVTPNLHEASLLCGFEVKDISGIQAAASVIYQMGASNVLIKGGHLQDEAVDILFDGEAFHTFAAKRIKTNNTHGTGCTLSAALATLLGQDHTICDAVKIAKDFITRAINASLDIGQGHGPSNPYAEILQLKARDNVIRDLQKAVKFLCTHQIGNLIPEIRSNFGFALPGAGLIGEVAAIPGRISQIKTNPIVYSQPAWGASRHVANIILSVMRHDPAMRSAMNIRYNPEILRAAEKAELQTASFDRLEEPVHIKNQEGSSLEWGVVQALENAELIPDLIYDQGDFGKEPVIRVLGRNPDEVAHKIIKIFELYQ